MSYDTDRIEHWLAQFSNHITDENADLRVLYKGIVFSSQDDGSIKVGIFELDEYYATKEQIERMEKVLFEFADKSPIY